MQSNPAQAQKPEIIGGAFPGQIAEATIDQFDALVSRSGCLSVGERQRAARFLRPAHAAAFTARRVFLRETLATRLGISPNTIEFEFQPGQKPQLGEGQRWLSFSQSATNGYTVVVLHEEGDVGVDVEQVDRVLDHVSVARRWFAPAEIDRLERSTDPEATRLEFMRTWTAREAAAKLTGQGLAKTLRHHEVLVEPLGVLWHPDGRICRLRQTLDSGRMLSIAWW